MLHLADKKQHLKRKQSQVECVSAVCKYGQGASSLDPKEAGNPWFVLPALASPWTPSVRCPGFSRSLAPRS